MCCLIFGALQLCTCDTQCRRSCWFFPTTFQNLDQCGLYVASDCPNRGEIDLYMLATPQIIEAVPAEPRVARHHLSTTMSFQVSVWYRLECSYITVDSMHTKTSVCSTAVHYFADRYQCGDDLIIPSVNASEGQGVDIVRNVSLLLNYANIGVRLRVY